MCVSLSPFVVSLTFNIYFHSSLVESELYMRSERTPIIGVLKHNPPLTADLRDSLVLTPAFHQV